MPIALKKMPSHLETTLYQMPTGNMFRLIRLSTLTAMGGIVGSFCGGAFNFKEVYHWSLQTILPIVGS